jgi:ribosome maturation factor RimP
MIDTNYLKSLVNEKLDGTENYLIDIKVVLGNKILIEIDNDQGISIADCVAVSRHVEHNLDREKEDFELQVSSPGLNQPFKIFRQYLKNRGRKVEVITNDGEKYSGELIKADEIEGIIALECEVKVKDEQTKKKKTIKQLTKLPLDQIKETKVVISFK